MMLKNEIDIASPAVIVRVFWDFESWKQVTWKIWVHDDSVE